MLLSRDLSARCGCTPTRSGQHGVDETTPPRPDLRVYRALGGTTLVEHTPKGMGRDLPRLRASRGDRHDGHRRHRLVVEKGHGDLVRAVRGRPGGRVGHRAPAESAGPGRRRGHRRSRRSAATTTPTSGASSTPPPGLARAGAPLDPPDHYRADARILDRLAAADLDRDGVGRARIVLCHTDYDLRDMTLHRERSRWASRGAGPVRHARVEPAQLGPRPNDTLRTKRSSSWRGRRYGAAAHQPGRVHEISSVRLRWLRVPVTCWRMWRELFDAPGR